MPNTHDPDTNEEQDDKVLDDLDPDEADAAGIQGGRSNSDDDYGTVPTRK